MHHKSIKYLSYFILFLFVFNIILALNSIKNSKIKYSCNSEESENKNSREELLLSKILLSHSVKLFVFNNSNIFRTKPSTKIIEITVPELMPPIA